MRALFIGGVLAVLCAPALGRDLLVTEMDNGDGSFTYWFEIDTQIDRPPEIAFMDLTIMGNLHQVQAHDPLYAQFGPSWAPNVVFTSDAGVASLFDPAYAAAAHLDTVIDDTWWLGIAVVDLTPNDGNEFDGTSQVHVLATSFVGPGHEGLPGGIIPLAHVTTWGRNLWVSGSINYPNVLREVAFEWHVPEPSTVTLLGVGLVGLVAGMRRRRQQSVAAAPLR